MVSTLHLPTGRIVVEELDFDSGRSVDLNRTQTVTLTPFGRCDCLGSNHRDRFRSELVHSSLCSSFTLFASKIAGGGFEPPIYGL